MVDMIYTVYIHVPLKNQPSTCRCISKKHHTWIRHKTTVIAASKGDTTRHVPHLVDLQEGLMHLCSFLIGERDGHH